MSKAIKVKDGLIRMSAVAIQARDLTMEYIMTRDAIKALADLDAFGNGLRGAKADALTELMLEEKNLIKQIDALCRE